MGLDVNKLQERAERKSAKRTDRFNLQDGENYLRLLPPSLEYLKEDVDYITFEYLMHYNLGIEGNRTAEVCPKILGKQHRCPICEVVFKLYKTQDATDKTLAGSIRAKGRHIYNVLDLNNLDKGIQIMETGPKIYDEIVKFIANPKYSDILDLDQGRNITITKTPGKESSSGFAEYDVIPDPDITSIKDKLPENWKKQLIKLEASIPVPKSYEEIKNILEGEESSSEETTTSDSADKTTEDPVVDKTPDVITEVPADGEKPKCFGNDFGPKRPECIGCAYKIACRDEYLSID